MGDHGVQKMKFFPMGFENTLVKEKTNQYDSVEYQAWVVVEDAKMICEQLRQATADGICQDQGGHDFTVLSVDVEGYDMAVIKAAHKDGCKWDVVIVESPDISWMRQMGYVALFKSAYNTVFAKEGWE